MDVCASVPLSRKNTSRARLSFKRIDLCLLGKQYLALEYTILIILIIVNINDALLPCHVRLLIAAHLRSTEVNPEADSYHPGKVS